MNKRKQLALALITLVPVIMIAMVIFGFSSQDADKSTEQSDTVQSFVTKIFFPHFDEYSIEKQQQLSNTLMFVVRKTAHFCEYAALAFFLLIHLKVYLKRMPWLVSWILSTIYAGTDEFHQNFVSERAMRFGDVLIDSAGAIAGIIALTVLILIINAVKRKTSSK